MGLLESYKESVAQEKKGRGEQAPSCFHLGSGGAKEFVLKSNSLHSKRQRGKEAITNASSVVNNI